MGNGESQGLGGLHINHKLQLRWLLDREVGGLRPFEYLVHVRRRALVISACHSPVAHQAAGLRNRSVAEHRWHPMPYCQFRELAPLLFVPRRAAP